MTESEWLASEDPAAMLRQVSIDRPTMRPPWRMLSARKLRLWVASVYQSSTYDYGLWDDLRPFWSKGESSGSQDEYTLTNNLRVWSHSEYDEEGDPTMATRAALLREVVGNPFLPWMRERDFVAGKPIPATRLRIVQESWLTSQVISMAGQIYESRAFDELPILADALQDAGCVGTTCPRCQGAGYNRVGVDRFHTTFQNLKCCDCEGTGNDPSHPILEHLRSPGPHVRGCWALDLILGKE